MALAEEAGKRLQQKGTMLAVAESCTGGGIAQAITEIAGSSQWFDRGFVTYSNLAKEQMLGVHTETLEQFGAVSAETAVEMAEGVLQNSDADYAISVTGVAGPGGGSAEKPVGTVFIAWCGKNATATTKKYLFDGNRQQVRQQAMESALYALIKLLTAS